MKSCFRILVLVLLTVFAEGDVQRISLLADNLRHYTDSNSKPVRPVAGDRVLARFTFNRSNCEEVHFYVDFRKQRELNFVIGRGAIYADIFNTGPLPPETVNTAIFDLNHSDQCRENRTLQLRFNKRTKKASLESARADLADFQRANFTDAFSADISWVKLWSMASKTVMSVAVQSD